MWVSLTPICAELSSPDRLRCGMRTLVTTSADFGFSSSVRLTCDMFASMTSKYRELCFFGRSMHDLKVSRATVCFGLSGGDGLGHDKYTSLTSAVLRLSSCARLSREMLASLIPTGVGICSCERSRRGVQASLKLPVLELLSDDTLGHVMRVSVASSILGFSSRNNCMRCRRVSIMSAGFVLSSCGRSSCGM